MNRKKIHHPSEIPQFATLEEFKEFWDSHEAADSLVSYYRRELVLEFTISNKLIKFILVGVPSLITVDANQRENISHEEHVGAIIEDYRNRLYKFALENANKVKDGQSIYIDFWSQKILTDKQ